MTNIVLEYSTKRTIVGGGALGAGGNITFSVDRLGVPGIYKVVLFDRNTCNPVEKNKSDVSGNITFTDLSTDQDKFFVVAFDTISGGEKPAISDFLEAT